MTRVKSNVLKGTRPPILLSQDGTRLCYRMAARRGFTIFLRSLERGLDLSHRVARNHASDGAACMSAFFAEYLHHQV